MIIILYIFLENFKKFFFILGLILVSVILKRMEKKIMFNIFMLVKVFIGLFGMILIKILRMLEG